jgi:pilus assembly protein CpaB
MIGLAVIFGGASIFIADMWLKNAAAERAKALAQPADTTPRQQFATIVVAKQQLKYGTALTSDLMQEIPWPQDKVPAGAFKTMAELTASGNRVVLSPIEANEPVLLAKLSGADGRATLSNALGPGMRAVTISTDEVAAVAGFVTPGDRVDVILTRSVQKAAAEVEVKSDVPDFASETILSNIKVLSVEGETDERAGSAKSASTVTLEVNDEAVKKIALARSVGTLTLSLRAAGEQTVGASGSLKVSDLFGEKLIDKIKTLSVTPDTNAGTAPKNDPSYKTVIVTRGLVQEAYQVIEQQ